VISGLALAAMPARDAGAGPARHGRAAGGTRAATATGTRGVTQRAVAVGGLLAATGTGTGAEVGAQARLRRANRAGGVAGRRVRYVGTEADGGDVAQDDAAIGRLATEVFAVVPAASAALDAAGLARAQLPFFGAADSSSWSANRYGFGFTGAQAALSTRIVNPAWGVQLRALMGRAQGDRVVIVTDDTPLGVARGEQARISVRASGFTAPAPTRIAPPPAPAPDLAPIAAGVAGASPAAVLLLTTASTTAGLARQLAVLGFTGTVGVSAEFYQPAAPEFATGLTALVPYAPLESATAANRRLAADVEAFAPGTQITAAVIAGYWAADQFLAILSRVGRQLTVRRFLAAANGGDFTYAVPDTIGLSSWPAMHTRAIPCGALVQSDGSRYYVAGPYHCDDPIVVKPKARRRP
jgi:hypothetical protein